MTCVYPSPTSRPHKVPELKTLAKLSCELQNFDKSSNFTAFLPYFFNQDSCDNNEKRLLVDAKEIYDVSPMLRDMKFEVNRLKSFEHGWPLSYINPKDCAAVGLYYLGDGDKVKCVFCTGIITNWEEGDKPLVEHVKHFPMCPYLLNRDVGNVPISGRNGAQPWQISNAHAERPMSVMHAARQSQPTYRTKFPSLSCLDKRLHTYYNWHDNSRSTAVSPKDLAESGFFYTGVSDVVTCFCCGGQIGDWTPGDDTWIEHAKHFPTCAYVKSTKGSSFIEQARKNVIEAASATNTEENAASACASCSEYTVQSLSEEVNMSQEMETMQIMENSEATTTGESQFMCRICMELGTRVAFLPCGHSLACPNCAKELRICPMCRKEISSFIRLYFD